MSTFTIAGTLPGMNEIISAARTHWSQSATQKKTATLRVVKALKGRRRFDTPIALEIHWFEPTLKRDLDNVTAGVKFILDGMVVAGKITNDSRAYVNGLSHKVSLDRQNPRVEVTVKELNG